MSKNSQTIHHEKLIQIITLMENLQHLKVTMNLYSSMNFYTQIFELLPNHMEEIHLVVSDIDVFDQLPALPPVIFFTF